MGKKLPNAPIFYVLAQVRFAALPKISERISDVQEDLRENGFQDPFDESITTIEFDMQATQPGVQTKAVKRWISRNAERTAGFLFDANSMTFHTTAYEDSATLVDTFTKGLEIFNKHVNIQLVDRIGVRTLDAVFPKDGENIGKYINSSVLGLYGKLDYELQHAFSETVFKSPQGTVMTRVLTQSGGISMPPDLMSPHFVLANRFVSKSGIHTMIDIDATKGDRVPFNLNHVKGTMIALKTFASESFWKTATKEAKVIWNQE
jgi:uncharacterized protein (TIGR04255 family)